MFHTFGYSISFAMLFIMFMQCIHHKSEHLVSSFSSLSVSERCPTLAKLEGLVPRAHRLRRRHHQRSVPAWAQINRRVRVTGRVQALSCRPLINCFCSGIISAGSDITFFVSLALCSTLVFCFLSFRCSIQ